MPDARLAVHGSDELDGHERVEAEADQRAFEVEPIGQGVEHAGGAFGHVPLERGAALGGWRGLPRAGLGSMNSTARVRGARGFFERWPQHRGGRRDQRRLRLGGDGLCVLGLRGLGF
jgi:hypothetical protein